MPHSFVTKKAEKSLHQSQKNEFKTPRVAWETFADWVYLIGGIIFIIGSIFFLPEMKRFGDTGVWIFIVGSLLYIIVTGHDLIMSIKSIKRNKKETIWMELEFLSALMYTVGTFSYLVGSILFLSKFDQVFEGAISFIIGSLLFLFGATINVLEITNQSSDKTLQLVNGTAIMYITGSLLFLVASIPYVWNGINIHDQNIIYNYVALEYIGGSILFTMGGVLSIIKTCTVKREILSIK